MSNVAHVMSAIILGCHVMALLPSHDLISLLLLIAQAVNSNFYLEERLRNSFVLQFHLVWLILFLNSFKSIVHVFDPGLYFVPTTCEGYGDEQGTVLAFKELQVWSGNHLKIPIKQCAHETMMELCTESTF